MGGKSNEIQEVKKKEQDAWEKEGQTVAYSKRYKNGEGGRRRQTSQTQGNKEKANTKTEEERT